MSFDCNWKNKTVLWCNNYSSISDRFSNIVRALDEIFWKVSDVGAGRLTWGKWEIMWLTACCIHCSKHNCTDSSFTLNIKRWQFLFTEKLKHFCLEKDEWATGKLCPLFVCFSIYEKLIQFCSIDELGTNYPKVRCSNFTCQGSGWKLM